MNANVILPAPVRALPTDDPEQILAFAADAMLQGVKVALATLVAVRGGAARSLGSQIAVASDGRFCGYVSGGCVEAAVASEALLAMSAGKDQIVKFGAGSRFFDIVLPCGGGITIAIHVLKDVSVILQTLELLNKRLSAALRYSPCGQILDLVPSGGRPRWIGGDFVTVYHPRPRILVCGETVEAMAVASIGKAAGYDVVRTGQGRKEMSASIDEFTAVVLLRHDLEAEQATLNEALRSSAFYIGALGSTRTHEKRVQRLQANGWSSTDIDRIKAPIGVFGPTRDASSLALSVMADVAASRLAASYEDRR